MDLDMNPKNLEGSYTGQTRGRIQSIAIKAIPNAITIESNGDGKVDTLNTYIGNHTWMDDNTIINIKDGIMRTDAVSGHYLLKKQ